MLRTLLLTLLLLGGLHTQAQAQIPTTDLIFGALYDGNLNTLNTTTATDLIVTSVSGANPPGAAYTTGINGVNNTAITFDTINNASPSLYYASYAENYLTGQLNNVDIPDMTFSAWVNTRTGARGSADYPTIFAWGDHIQEKIAFFLQPLTGETTYPSTFRLGFVVSRFGKTVQRPQGIPPIVSTGPRRVYTSLDSVRVPSGQWKHVLVRFRKTGTGNARLMEYEAFLDGVSAQSGSNSYYTTEQNGSAFIQRWISDSLANYQVTNAPRFTVGAIRNPQSSSNPLNLFGSIDNLRIYKRYLSDFEVAALYAERTQNPTAVDPGTQIAFRAYPNPAAENLNLEMDQPLGGTLRILDASGRVLQTTQLPAALNHTVDVSYLTSGLYIAQLNGATLRFMKQ